MLTKMRTREKRISALCVLAAASVLIAVLSFAVMPSLSLLKAESKNLTNKMTGEYSQPLGGGGTSPAQAWPGLQWSGWTPQEQGWNEDAYIDLTTGARWYNPNDPSGMKWDDRTLLAKTDLIQGIDILSVDDFGNNYGVIIPLAEPDFDALSQGQMRENYKEVSINMVNVDTQDRIQLYLSKYDEKTFTIYEYGSGKVAGYLIQSSDAVTINGTDFIWNMDWLRRNLPVSVNNSYQMNMNYLASNIDLQINFCINDSSGTSTNGWWLGGGEVFGGEDAGTTVFPAAEPDKAIYPEQMP